ncbi:HlyIII-domain-containing protein [Auriscalpium vulgare]|uniref:HlyIII-domain-containing protein n=1 Tax=Auriscalpium vulgare TaxID=40419 RepID=A0ACB8RJ57_9AGAM|nr:HlyIII-domain-containing protein [Auriscalpium vulgare]
MATTVTTTATTAKADGARARRRKSTVHTLSPRMSCQPLHHSLDALDLSSASPTATLASLRVLVLSYLADLETSLSQIESPSYDFGIADALSKGELRVEEARVWARDGMEMLNRIRTDVCSHLPEFTIDSASVESYVTSRLADLPDVPSLMQVAAHLPEMPDVRSHLPHLELRDVRSKLDDVRSRLHDMDLRGAPEHYIPILSKHLHTLHAHLSSMQVPSSIALPSFTPNVKLSEFVDKIMSSDLFPDVLRAPSIEKAEDTFGRAAMDVAVAVKRSLHGAQLIKYVDLPEQWRNNPFVTHGYRFIPLNRWPLIIASVFALHNETLNIHTHLIPFILWTINLLPTLRDSSIPSDTPVLAFTVFALLCLFTSVVWHTMAGCAHHRGMTLCAKIDYVGIGWLISASVGTIVHHGFQCHANAWALFLSLCFIMGSAGTVLPFAEWFNKPTHKRWRIVFFVSLAFTAVAPLTHLAILHSTREMFAFIRPVVPSLASYIVGLVFYATHFPECVLAPRWAPQLAWLGGGSHAIWHAFIVLAISQHRAAMPLLKGGLVDGVCPVVDASLWGKGWIS